MTTNSAPSLLLALPQDVQQRLLAGCRYEDLFSIASVCRAFRSAVNDPKFTKVRQSHGFVERGVVLLGTRRYNAVDIRSAQTRSIKVSITAERLQLDSGDTTTDGRRLFVGCNGGSLGPHQTIIYALDVISRQWSRFARLPDNRGLHCMEWYAGRLYVAGGFTTRPTRPQEVRTSFCVYNEATRSWDDLPPMPVGCVCASSGVIGDQLLVAGGSGHVAGRTLQIFDFTTGQWRLGPPLPERGVDTPGVVSEDKLFVPVGFGPGDRIMLIYDPQSGAWTQERIPGPFYQKFECACAHYGSIFVFLEGGGAYERAPDGSWSAYTCTHVHARDALQSPADFNGIVGWGTTRVESILLG